MTATLPADELRSLANAVAGLNSRAAKYTFPEKGSGADRIVPSLVAALPMPDDAVRRAGNGEKSCRWSFDVADADEAAAIKTAWEAASLAFATAGYKIKFEAGRTAHVMSRDFGDFPSRMVVVLSISWD